MNEKQNPKHWNVLDSNIAFENRWMKVKRDIVMLPNGKILDDYYLWIAGDVSLVVPITSDGKFILVRQYKHASAQMMIEFPAGMIDSGENPEMAAMRELSEETGYTTSSLSLIGKVTDFPTKAVGNIFIFLARDVKPGKQTSFDENEDIQTLVFTQEQLIDNIFEGKIWVAGTISAVFLAFQHLGKLNFVFV